MNCHWNVSQLKKIQKKILETKLQFWKKNYLIVYIIENNLRINLKFSHLVKYL